MTLGRRLFLSSLAAGFATPAQAADPDVVIVGAGVAGLAAARTLMAAHKTVLVLEARDRIGGRALPHTTPLCLPLRHRAPQTCGRHSNPPIARPPDGHT